MFHPCGVFLLWLHSNNQEVYDPVRGRKKRGGKPQLLSWVDESSCWRSILRYSTGRTLVPLSRSRQEEQFDSVQVFFCWSSHLCEVKVQSDLTRTEWHSRWPGDFWSNFSTSNLLFLNHLYKSVTLSCNRTVRSAAWSQTSLHWVNGRGVIATLVRQWIVKMTLESAFWWRRSAQIRFILQVSNWNWRLDSPHT